MATTPGMTLSAIGPGTWDCSQLAVEQIAAINQESEFARIAAPQVGYVVQSLLASDAPVYEMARVAFRLALSVIR